MKTISVLIPDGEHHLGLRVMRSLGLSRQVEVDLMISDRRSPYRLSRHCRRHHFAPPSTDDRERCDAIVKAIAKARIDVLLPISVAGIRFVSAERETLAKHVALPPLPEVTALDMANDKISIYRLAQQHGIPTPPSLVFPDDFPASSALDQLPYPVLLKPPSREGGRGITTFQDSQTLIEFLEANGAGARYLIQSRLPGLDFGLNVLCRDGEILAHTAQHNVVSAVPPFGPPAGVHFLEDSGVLETGRKLVSALRWSGVANLDMLRCEATGETMILEMNPRYWFTLVGSARAGVNFPYLACLAALGRPLPKADYQPIAYAERSLGLKQTVRMATGRLLKGLRFKNTAVWISLTDPLPALSHFGKTILKTSAKRAARLFRSSQNTRRSP